LIRSRLEETKFQKTWRGPSIGAPPQDKKYAGEPTRLEIGDGNTFRDSPRLEKIPLVGQHRYGATLSYGDIALDFRIVNRSRAYRTEPEGHSFTSLSLTYRP
jgi:hypothetical protein